MFSSGKFSPQKWSTQIRSALLLSLSILYSGFDLPRAHAFSFDAVLPGIWKSVRPEDMSFFPDKFPYSDDYNFLKSLGAAGTATRPSCADTDWSDLTENGTDSNGKSVSLSHHVCTHIQQTPVSSEETAKRLKNAQYILRHISKGSFPPGFTADKLAVGKRVPYSADWYPFYAGSTLANPNSAAIKNAFGNPLLGFGLKKFQNRNVKSFAPTSDDLLNWSRKGTLSKELENFPTPVIIDILNGKTDPNKSDFYEFTRSEQDRIRSEDTSLFKEVFSATTFKQNVQGWSGHGMCESWSAAAINEPRPIAHRVRKKVVSGKSSGMIEFTLSAETIAAANAIAYNRFMFFDMDDSLQKTEAGKARARSLLNEGYVRVGEKCRMKESDYLDFIRSIGFDSRNVSKVVTKNDPEKDSKSCYDLNFGLLTIVTMNKLGVYADLFFADFIPTVKIWHYPVAGAYLEDQGAIEKVDADAAYGTKTQRRVNLYIVHAMPHAKVEADDDFQVEKYQGRLDLSESGRILGGRSATSDMPDYLVDVRRPDLAALGSPLAIIKWIEENSTSPNTAVVLPEVATSALAP